MNYGANVSNVKLTQDNSKIKSEVQGYFARGDMKWSTGATVDDKEEGVKLILQGLKSLKIWIAREYDPPFIASLNATYASRFEDAKKKMDYLENYRNGTLVEQPRINANGEAMQIKKPAQGGGGGQGNKDNQNDEEKTKLEKALGDAIVTEKPNVKWTDIAGLLAAKASLQEAVILPIRFPQIFEGARKPWKGILLYGPPGTGKTYLAKACATEADGTFFSVSSSDLISKYVGESEKLIRTLFAMAREKKPSIIFIDEIDSMCGSRGEGQNEASRRVITEFLIQMQGVGHDDKGILVLGATNLPWALDTAIRRRIYIPLPDEQAREYMIEHSLKGNKHTLQSDQIRAIAEKTEGYSGSDISVFIRDALYEPVRKLQNAKKFKKVMINGQEKLTPASEQENGPNVKVMGFLEVNPEQLYVPDIQYEDLISSLTKSKTSVSQGQLKEYEDWTQQFGQEG